MAARGAAPLQRTLSRANGTALSGASLTLVLLCRAGDDADLEGGHRQDQELAVINFLPATKITQRFTRIAGEEVCRECESVKPAPL